MSKTFDIVQYVNEHRQVPFPFVDSAKLDTNQIHTKLFIETIWMAKLLIE